MSGILDRRTVLAAPLALTACGERSQAADAFEAPTAAPASPAVPLPILRELAAFPLGVMVTTDDLDNPQAAELAARHFSQITPGLELKMEVLLRDDFSLDFARADRIAAWAASNRQRLFGHCLVWYAQEMPAFKRLDGDAKAFGAAYDRYIRQVAGRYRGRIAGWDVVNEAVGDDGGGLRPSLWVSNLGAEDHIVRAFEQARAADPQAVLFLNDYGLEVWPKKRAAFLRLAERLLKRGAPLGGLGSQSHIDIDLVPGACTAAIRELARFGLPIHVSELDCSLKPGALDLRPRAEKLRLQAARYGELLEAFQALPPAQRFAFTVWGVRDDGSWLNSEHEHKGADAPLLFDARGAPKPAFDAVAAGLRRA